jgi:hypothetical protein
MPAATLVVALPCRVRLELGGFLGLVKAVKRMCVILVVLLAGARLWGQTNHAVGIEIVQSRPIIAVVPATTPAAGAKLKAGLAFAPSANPRPKTLFGIPNYQLHYSGFLGNMYEKPNARNPLQYLNPLAPPEYTATRFWRYDWDAFSGPRPLPRALRHAQTHEPQGLVLFSVGY